MSRSIHTTNRSLAELKRRKFSSEEARQAALTEARFELRRKRRIKRQVNGERRAVEPEGRRTPAGAIPIRVDDEGLYVLHAASVDDVRAMLDALPPAAVEGLGGVRLLLGREYMMEKSAAKRGTLDPYTGRPGYLMFPGCYAADTLGSYKSSTGVISIYAYVLDQERLQVPQAIAALFLRLQTLKILMHEIAHYHDEVERVRRGRWLSDRRGNFEWYAEKMEHVWADEIVVPYLERTYARECRAFRAWVRQRGGIALPLGFFVGDRRRTERSGPERTVYPTSYAFEDWLKKLPGCGSREESQLALAKLLNRADRYEECLAIVDLLLATNPQDVKARACRAETLLDLGRYEEARDEADAVIEVRPAEHAAWRVRAILMTGMKEWADLLESCIRWEKVRPMPAWIRASCHRFRATAHCALGEREAMEASLVAYGKAVRSKDPEAAKRRLIGVRREVFRRAGQPLPMEADGE